jgi:putative effector of murein hydrolase
MLALPVRGRLKPASLARGALFGLGRMLRPSPQRSRIGLEEGSIAGLVMILTGLLNLLAAPLLAYLLR